MAGRGRPAKNKSEVVVDEQPTKLSKKEQSIEKSKRDVALEGLLKGVLKGSKMLSDTRDKYTVKQWFDTGSYALNLLISGSMYKGVPDNRVTQFVGDQSSAKSYITKKIMNSAINTGWIIHNIDTEGDVEISDYDRAGMDTSKIMMVDDVDDTKKVINKVSNIIDSAEEDYKWMITIDSIGNLASEKESKDAVEGNNKTDMTRAKDLKSFFRITLKKAFSKRIPMILINHEYESQGFIPQKVVSGGKGSRLASTIICEFSKSQLKIGENVVGVKIRAKNVKNRFAIEGKFITFWIFHKGGIKKQSCLDELMIEYGIARAFKDGRSSGIEIDGEKYLLKDLLSNEEKYDEVLKTHNIDERLGEFFKYKHENEMKDDIDSELDELTDETGESKDE
jgi:RecA/RadA recombinase